MQRCIKYSIWQVWIVYLFCDGPEQGLGFRHQHTERIYQNKENVSWVSWSLHISRFFDFVGQPQSSLQDAGMCLCMCLFENACWENMSQMSQSSLGRQVYLSHTCHTIHDLPSALQLHLSLFVFVWQSEYKVSTVPLMAYCNGDKRIKLSGIHFKLHAGCRFSLVHFTKRPLMLCFAKWVTRKSLKCASYSKQSTPHSLFTTHILWLGKREKWKSRFFSQLLC